MSVSSSAVVAGYRQQLRVSLRRSGQVAVVLAAVPQALVFGWMLRHADSADALTRVAFGQVLLASWTASVLTLAWMLSQESWSGTLELGLSSPAALVLPMFGKGVALVVGGFVGGIVSTTVLLTAAGHLPRVDDVPLTALSFAAAAAIAVPATAFVVAPLSALSPGTRNFVNGLIPLGIVLGGFLFPVSALPDWMEPIARLLPLSWMTDALAGAATGRSVAHCLGHLAVGTAVAGVWALVAVRIFGAVERRFVEHGSLPQ
ncbi:MAG: rane protein [Actinomycetia bacterium]|nr:rane protein [Actinomycetes bacterium]